MAIHCAMQAAPPLSLQSLPSSWRKTEFFLFSPPICFVAWDGSKGEGERLLFIARKNLMLYSYATTSHKGRKAGRGFQTQSIKKLFQASSTEMEACAGQQGCQHQISYEHFLITSSSKSAWRLMNHWSREIAQRKHPYMVVVSALLWRWLALWKQQQIRPVTD